MTKTADMLQHDAKTRTATHVGGSTTRPLVENYDTIGISGEWAFAKEINRHPETYRESRGDGGIDFKVNLGFTVQVKTATSPYGLWVERGKANADIFVLALNESGTPDGARMVGWAWRAAVLAKEPVASRHGIVSHRVPVDELRPMSELLDRLHRD